MPKTKKLRCSVCNKKLKMVDLCIKKCECGKNLCVKHNSPWNHECSVNTRKMLISKHKKDLSEKLVTISNNKLNCI